MDRVFHITESSKSPFKREGHTRSPITAPLVRPHTPPHTIVGRAGGEQLPFACLFTSRGLQPIGATFVYQNSRQPRMRGTKARVSQHAMSSDNSDDDRTVIRPLKSPPPGATPASAPAPAPALADMATLISPQARLPIPAAATPAVDAVGVRAQALVSSAASSAGDSGNALPLGTYLGEFELTSVLGEGGFGIVYLAWDHSLERRVALKEYMPAALSARLGNTQVQVKSERHRDTFEAGLKSFVNEAKLLASFDHPSLVKVYRFWEANGTAYMVMPFYEGVTLKDKLRELGEPPSEAWLMGLLAPLTEALAVIHAQNCFHRDIAPDNVILIGERQKPLLLDFGAARRVIGDMTQALTVILKPGYAPVEQYAEAPNMKQGPWTDVYALAASVHFAIMGRTPPTSVSRLMSDSYVPLEQAAAGRYSAPFLRALDRALRVRPEERTPSIAELRQDLGLRPLIKGEGEGDDERPAAREGLPSSFEGRTLQAGHVPAQTASAEAKPGRKRWLILGASLGLLGIAITAWLGGSAPPAKDNPAQSPVTAVVAADTAVPAAPALQPSASAMSPSSFDPAQAIADVVQRQSAGFTVEAKLPREQFVIGKDRLSFRIKSARDGHVQVLLLGQDGSLLQFLPNAQIPQLKIKAGQELELPPKSWPVEAAEPPGRQQFLIIVSAEPRDYSALSSEREDVFLKLPTGDKAMSLMRDQASTSKVPFLLGRSAACKTPACDDYGATRFTADVVR